MSNAEQTAAAAGGAVGAGAAGVLAYLSDGPAVTPIVFLLASAVGGIAGGVLSSLREPGPITVRALITIAGYGAVLGAGIVTSLLWALGLPPTLQAVGMVSSAGGTMAWTISKRLPEITSRLMDRALSKVHVEKEVDK